MSETTFQPNHKVLNAFIKWIESPRFDPQHAEKWARLYTDNPEAAMCEATFWAVLHDSGVDVEPNADLTGSKQCPDYRCMKDGAKFYVEVTCIQIDTATRESGLQSIPDGKTGAQFYHHLNDAIFNKCVNKTPQCAGLEAPCLLAIGTFHFQGSVLGVKKTFMEWLLTGEASIGWKFDARLGKCVGKPYQVTSFRSATFTRLTRLEGIEQVRQPISAVLVGGFGCDPVNLFGLLHPNPVREFDPGLLNRIPFCRQRIKMLEATVSAEWIQTPEDWEKD